MATITLEVPDKIAKQLEGADDPLFALLQSYLPKESSFSLPEFRRGHPAWTEVTGFLAEAPSIQEIVDYKLSESLQDRIEDLLAGNSEDDLTQPERDELEGFIQIIRFFNLLKASLRASLP